jgi:hypothetical protein
MWTLGSPNSNLSHRSTKPRHRDVPWWHGSLGRTSHPLEVRIWSVVSHPTIPKQFIPVARTDVTSELVSRWRADASTVERFSVDGGRTLRACADELEQSLHGMDVEALSLTSAAARSGYHPDSLGRMIRRGTLRNVGSQSRPKVRACELPMKPGRTEPALMPSSNAIPSTIEIAREALSKRRGHA